MKTSYKVLVLAVALMIVSVTAFAAPGLHQAPGVVVGEGEKTTVVGTAVLDGATWTVVAPEGTFTVPLGNPRMADQLGLDLTEGEEIAVFGFLAEDVLVPIIIVADGEGYFLRDTDGSPLWPVGRQLGTR